MTKQQHGAAGSAGSEPPRRVTLRDVAQAAGVSHQTVSRAINDKGEIDPETRRRVLDAARELRYRPSRFARGLVRPDTITVGLIVQDVVNPFYPELMAGVIEAAENKGWQVVVGSTQNDRDNELALVRSLGRQVDALIGFLDHSDAELAPYVEGVPLVVMDRHQKTSHGVVDIDIETGVRHGIQHLVERGHQKIGMIDCLREDGQSEDGLERRDCFLAVVEELGLPVDQTWIVAGTESVAGGEAGFAELRSKHPDVSAVFAYNDVVAIGAHRAARRLGLDVPKDCAVLGFDGLSIGELLDPPLTTVHIDKRRMGELAIDQVDGLLNGTPVEHALLPTELVVRGST
ncbi:LacI family DNA-binding transcriptional regulator [Promicromonospora panici]|uniref:LacI family DNA-binding transcriptional regulator n=1 Tax=Promicromonospora panici TaxID=2219658 RepID=UPI00101C1CFF|nr:LacI family DNA-binding transcriptional regulator [Promicromonospora panici]